MKTSLFWSDQDEFTEAIGLWMKATPGHTTEVAEMESVHSGPDAASRMILLLENGSLAPSELHGILCGLARLQQTRPEDDAYGCFRWYAEESRPKDTNAAFFIGLNLLVLNAGYSEHFSDESREVVVGMFDGLDVWFDHEVASGICYYPNKYLGDLVCSWLLKEALDRPVPSSLEDAMRDAGTYWLEQRWGWGEHLSDCYSTILLKELSALLLLAKSLPEDLYDLYRNLLFDLLRIDDFFNGGARVPAIRSYAFQKPAGHVKFRKQMEKETFEAACIPDLLSMRLFIFGPCFQRRGWQELAGEAEPVFPERTRKTMCYGEAVATSHIKDGFRIGSLSQFPIMHGTDQATWGLSWQSMPVSFDAAKETTAGFLRWQTRENGRDRFHPARDKHQAYLHNALSDLTLPPPTGQTSSLQEGMRVVALRTMRVVSGAWEQLADGWDITGEAPEVVESSVVSTGGSKLVLRLPGEVNLCFWHIPVSSTEERPEIHQDGTFWSWRVKRNGEGLRQNPQFAHLWFVGLPGDPDPVLETLPGWIPVPEGPRRKIHWPAFGREIALSVPVQTPILSVTGCDR